MSKSWFETATAPEIIGDRSVSAAQSSPDQPPSDHDSWPEVVGPPDDRWMLPRIGPVHIRVRTALLTLLAAGAAVGAYKYSGSSDQAPADAANSSTASGAKEKKSVSKEHSKIVSKKKDAEKEQRKAVDRTPEQNFDIQRVGGFSVYREGNELHFKFPEGLEQKYVSFTIGQDVNGVPTDNERLSLFSQAGEWVGTIDSAYLVNDAPIKIIPQFYKGGSEGWVRGYSIDIPLK